MVSPYFDPQSNQTETTVIIYNPSLDFLVTKEPRNQGTKQKITQKPLEAQQGTSSKPSKGTQRKSVRVRHREEMRLRTTLAAQEVFCNLGFEGTSLWTCPIIWTLPSLKMKPAQRPLG